MLTRFLFLVASLVAPIATQRSGLNRNILHYTPLKWAGAPVATLSTPDKKFHVYYQSPATKTQGDPFLWKSVQTKDFVHWEDGEAFLQSTAVTPASFGFGVIYPNPVKPVPSGDTAYTVLAPRTTDAGPVLTNRGTDDGLTARAVTVAGKTPWQLVGVTSADAFPLANGQSTIPMIAFLTQNACTTVHFTADDGRAGATDYGALTLNVASTAKCYGLNVKKLDSSRHIIAMTLVDSVTKSARTRYWVGVFTWNANKLVFTLEKDSLSVEQYLDLGTDASFFRLSRVNNQLKAIGYSADTTKLYPDGMSTALTLFRTLTYNSGLQQSFNDMTAFATYSQPSLPKDFALATTACSGHMSLTGKSIPAVDAGWVFNLMLSEGDAHSGWEIQFRTGPASDSKAQYLSLSYDGAAVLLDRSHTDQIGSKDSATATLTTRRLNPVKIVLDKALIEVFIDSDSSPTAVLSVAFKISAPITDICLSAKTKPGVLLKNSSMYQIPSIWGPIPVTTAGPGTDTGPEGSTTHAGAAFSVSAGANAWVLLAFVTALWCA